jgi:hypothetical protein
LAKQVTTAKKKPDFSAHAFLSAIGKGKDKKGKDKVSFQKREIK